MSPTLAPAITLEELIGWNDESAQKWIEFLSNNPDLLELPSGIYGTKTVRDLLKHIFGVEFRYSERLRGLTPTSIENIHVTSIGELALLHAEAINHYRAALANNDFDWSATVEFTTLSAGTQRATLRKMLAHALMHSIRHWAQLGTLARTAGHPAHIDGDLLFSPSFV